MLECAACQGRHASWIQLGDIIVASDAHEPARTSPPGPPAERARDVSCDVEEMNVSRGADDITFRLKSWESRELAAAHSPRTRKAAEPDRKRT